MRQLSLEDFNKPLSVETVHLDAPKAKTEPEVKPPLEGEILSGADPLNIAPPENLPAVKIPLALKPILAAGKISSRAEFMCVLTQGLPRNDYSLPVIIYRPDLLDYTQFQDLSDGRFELMQSLLDAATIQIGYHEGYPALPSGSPLWARFEFESPEDYALFEQYVSLPGARQVALLTGPTAGRAYDLFHTYYWGLRAQANDAFAVAHHHRLRDQRILKTDNKQFLESENLLTKLTSIMSSVNWDLLKDEPEKYVKTLATVMELQRKALGLSTMGGNKDGTPNAAQPIELTMRRITKTETPAEGGIPAEPEEELDIRRILNSSTDVQTLQELILRVGNIKK